MRSAHSAAAPVFLAALAALLLLPISPLAADDNDHAVYARFLEYRLALKNPQENGIRFFSNHYKDLQLAAVLEDREMPQRLDSLDKVRNRFRFGELIAIIHGYTVKQDPAGFTNLVLICDNQPHQGIKIVTVS